MESKVFESIPAELNFKIKNAKLNSQKNAVQFTTLLTPFSDSIFFIFVINVIKIFIEYRFYSLLLAVFLFVSTNLIGFHIYDFLIARFESNFKIVKTTYS